MSMISIVVPLYKGRRYVNNILEQVKRNADNVKQTQVQLILYNDFPEEKIEVDAAELGFVVEVVNAEQNLGIQGARVKGLEYAKGEYVLMLDQDDYIFPDFLASQLRNILENDADVSICKALAEKKPVYDSQLPFEKIVSLEFMLQEGNHIVSPGQALIKKSAIPSIWKSNLLKKNGVDDWFLWLCMLGEGRKFVCNDNVLYEHMENGANVSLNTVGMFESECEMLALVKKISLFEKVKIDVLERTIKKMQCKQIQTLDKFKKMFFVYDKWMFLKNNGNTIAEFMKKQGKMNICIYGLGYLGKTLISDLQGSGINLICAFDRNADYIEGLEVTVLNKVAPVKDVDICIVTLVDANKSFYDELKDTLKIPVISMIELLEKMEFDRSR